MSARPRRNVGGRGLSAPCTASNLQLPEVGNGRGRDHLSPHAARASQTAPGIHADAATPPGVGVHWFEFSAILPQLGGLRRYFVISVTA
jgi:hypothetical protein